MIKAKKFYCQFCGADSVKSTWANGSCPRCGTQRKPKEW